MHDIGPGQTPAGQWRGAAARRRLSAYLLGRGGPPPAAELRATGLAGYAYVSLPADHPLRPALRPDYLDALARHQRIKRELLPLLSAWHAAGIEVLLFKGFQLNEFVYPVPGMRFHGDVDVLLRPESLRPALEIARSLGWAEAGNSWEAGDTQRHGAFNLYMPGGPTQLDVHRSVLDGGWGRSAVQRRVTAAVWSGARREEWAGTVVRLPDPVDAFLAGVVLARCWREGWRLKPADALDFQHLVLANPAGREVLWARARELRCERSLAIFLRRCDPEAGRFRLRALRPEMVRRVTIATVREHRTPGGKRRRNPIRLLLRVPGALLAVTRIVPALWRAHAALRRHWSLPRILESQTPREDHCRCWPQRFRTTRAFRWAPLVLPRRLRGTCLVQALALYSELRRAGWPAVFVSGIRREAGGVVGHAWVEVDGRELRDAGYEGCRERYRVNFEYPPPRDAPTARRRRSG